MEQKRTLYHLQLLGNTTSKRQTASWWMMWYLGLILLLCVGKQGATGSTESPQGHLDSLGKHRTSDGHIEILHTLPTPEEFWVKYARDGIPVLFRGMANNSLGMRRWTDDYLRENYGDLRVKIEGKSEKEHYPEGDRGIGQDTLGYFLETYKTRNAYVVSQLPDPMSAEVYVPPFMTCGTFSERLLEANFWFSSGGTKSLLHRDADNAINCLYFGTKDWIFIDPKYEGSIPIAEEATEGYGGFAVLNPDSVDLLKYPEFADVPWSHGNVTAGDCIFLPRGYWHQVRSYGSRNMAVSLLFSRLNEIDLSDCEGARLTYKPLSDMDMVFTYDGHGEQTMGDTDPFALNETVQAWCKQGAPPLNRQKVFHFLVQDYRAADDNEDDLNSLSDADILLVMSDQVVKLLDTNGDGEISCEETSGLKLATLKKLANIIDSDPANTEEYEYAKFEPQEIREFCEDLLAQFEMNGEDSIEREEFIDAYRQLGGSQKIGSEIFDEICGGPLKIVALQQLKDSVGRVAELFRPKMKDRLTDVRWSEEEPDWKTEPYNHIHPDL